MRLWRSVSNDPNARLFRVIGLTGTHSYAAAKTEADQLARDTKDAPQVEMQLGVIALGQGHYAEAEELFRKLYKEGSPDLEPLAGLVNTYEAEHQPDRALALMQEETQRAPESNGKSGAAGGYRGSGRQEATRRWRNCRRWPRRIPRRRTCRSALAAGTEGRQAAGGFAGLREARQLAPDRKGLDADGREHGRPAGQEVGGDRELSQGSCKSRRTDPTVLNNLAFLLADTGGDTQARLCRLVSTAIRKTPNAPQFRDTLAWMQIKRHNTAEALPILRSLTTQVSGGQ